MGIINIQEQLRFCGVFWVDGLLSTTITDIILRLGTWKGWPFSGWRMEFVDSVRENPMIIENKSNIFLDLFIFLILLLHVILK